MNNKTNKNSDFVIMNLFLEFTIICSKNMKTLYLYFTQQKKTIHHYIHFLGLYNNKNMKLEKSIEKKVRQIKITDTRSGYFFSQIFTKPIQKLFFFSLNCQTLNCPWMHKNLVSKHKTKRKFIDNEQQINWKKKLKTIKGRLSLWIGFFFVQRLFSFYGHLSIWFPHTIQNRRHFWKHFCQSHYLRISTINDKRKCSVVYWLDFTYTKLNDYLI